MPSQQITLTRVVPGQSGIDMAVVTSAARRGLLAACGGACVALAALMPWAEFSSAGIRIGSMHLSNPLLATLGVIVLIGLCLLVCSAYKLVRQLTKPTVLRLLIIAMVGMLSIAGLEYGYLRAGSLSAYEYRPAVRMVGYSLGIAMLSCSIPMEAGLRLAALMRGKSLRPIHILIMAIGVTAAGALIGAVVLDGMPHIIDGTAYLLQARTYEAGRLSLDVPMYPELFGKELMHLRISDAGYFSKYPAGWPALLAVFDAAGVPWLANAVLAGVLVVLTYLLVAERSGRRLAGISAAGVAMCPWLWMNAGTMMSHLASAVWLWLFLWLFLRGVRTRARGVLLLAGVSLGAAALTRPSDAAFFAMPCVVASLYWLKQSPAMWLTRLPLVTLGALPGALIYLWMNKTLAGSGSTSAYGGGLGTALVSQHPDSITHALVWLHQGWVGLSSEWLTGAVPAALLIACGLIFGLRYLREHGLALACSASLLVCYAVFVFGGRAWIGPRWYVPLIPCGALLIAAGAQSAAQYCRARSAGGVLSAGYMRSLLVVCGVTFLVAVPAQVVELLQSPPHGIDGRVVQTVERAGLTNAVVALPVDGLDPLTHQPNYKRGIAGMWSMRVPFENSGVIYVCAVEGWSRMASEAWPGRELYAMNDIAGDYSLTPVRRATVGQAAEARP